MLGRQASNMQEEIRRGRLRMVRDLARLFAPSAERLAEAYRGVLPELERVLRGLDDPLNSVYSEDDARQVVAIEAMRARIARELRDLERVIASQASTLQAGGVGVGIETGAANMTAGGMGVAFNRPTVQSVVSAIDYVDSAAFRDAVGRLGTYHAEQIANLIISGQAQGQSPALIVRLAREYFTVRRTPEADAYNLIQTTQIYSARRGTQAVYLENGVSQWIWSANIGDARTCRACIAMHGTVHPTTDVLNDHHRGRCAMVPVTPTWRELGFADGGEVPIETGVDWFNRQDEETQRRAVGNNLLFEAIQRGEVAFSPDTIVGVYDNPIFGEMRRARSFREIIGQ